MRILRRPILTGLCAGALFGVLLVLYFINLQSPDDLAPGWRITSAPYQWSARCPKTRYEVQEDLPDGCLQDIYHVRKPASYALSHADTAFTWYRVGDDALKLSCFGKTACIICAIVRGRFAGPEERRGAERDVLHGAMETVRDGPVAPIT
jgi:hypothetical protein